MFTIEKQADRFAALQCPEPIATNQISPPTLRGGHSSVPARMYLKMWIAHERDRRRAT
jgi:hypothetical protein